ncbi:hypothetical protein CCACVL1_21308 [Corchorus capsularis]|uniref:Uncharacterized protein n=1 Tax=Corchorus capsularis TaxID=210143 RepID=A0A1R3H754_COCAP|nr:hypothetical protein CCACVL1_21308 [Corchorus capsularis]
MAQSLRECVILGRAWSTENRPSRLVGGSAYIALVRLGFKLTDKRLMSARLST